MTINAPRYAITTRDVQGRLSRIWTIIWANVRAWGTRIGPLLLTAFGFLCCFVPLLIAIILDEFGFRTTVGLSSFADLVYTGGVTYELFLFILVMTTLVGSGVIADDLRTKAISLYLSRPITVLDYLTAKAGVLGTFLGLMCILPGILVTVIGAILDLFNSTVAFQALGAFLGVGALVSACFSGLGLLLSSISSKRTVAAAGIFAVLLLNFIFVNLIAGVPGASNWAYASPWNDVQCAAAWAFGLGTSEGGLYAPEAVGVLLGISVVCYLVLYARLSRLEVVTD